MDEKRKSVCRLIIGLAVILSDPWRVGTCAPDDFDREPILYSSAPTNNAVTQLEQRLAAGKTRLGHEAHFGYLRSLLNELDVPVSSQMLVFSKTSLQRHRINPRRPRAIYFSDDTYVGFCQGGEVLEISAVDPQLGTVFYTLEQKQRTNPLFVRQGESCLLCHGSSQTQWVPGHLVRSVFTDTKGLPILSAGGYRIDHTSPIQKRWGGWYVTGTHGQQSHLGNLIIDDDRVPEPIDNTAGMNVIDLGKRINRADYLSGHSDLVALMVLEHQAEGHNLIARAGFQTRVALHQEMALNRELGKPVDYRWDSTTSRIRGAGDPLVKYLLFADEAKIPYKIQGTSSFAAEFGRRGPRDQYGRSLRDLDMERRLFKYPCSYLIYSASFDALPMPVKHYILRQMWEILNDRGANKEFSHLQAADRQAIREILTATKLDLPAYWRQNDPPRIR